jgi:uroporphyrinogen-III synthase
MEYVIAEPCINVKDKTEPVRPVKTICTEDETPEEMAELIRSYGGEPIQAPSMREVPLTDQREALAFGETLLASDWDVLILLTGVGTRMLIAACATRWPKDEVVKAGPCASGNRARRNLRRGHGEHG